MKNSIKKAQSQACLGFAERKNFRPLAKLKKLSLTLALLLTAVGGAWAQGDYLIDVDFASSYNRMETIFHCTIMSLDPTAEIKGTLNLSVDGESKGIFNIDNEMFDGSIAPVDAGQHTWSAVFSPDGGGSFNSNGNFTIDKLYTSIAYNGSTSINMGEGESTELEVYVTPDGTDGLSYSSSDASVASITKKENSNDTYIIQAKATGTATITFSFAGNTNYKAAEEDKTITVTVLPAPIKVTTNAAEEGGTFTEAWFNMPANDVTAEYELVRDMSVQMTTKVGNAADGADYRIRIKKDNQTGKFVPAEMNPQAMAGLITVTDDIEEKTLTNVTDYTVSIFAVDGDNNPTGNAIAFADLVPGRYVAIATAADGSAYDGATEQSNVFVLFQGYEIEVPAGEFVTYYKDEALGLGEEHYTAGAALYTITDVNGTTATATELEITTDEPPLAQVAPAYTPLLVYNGSDEDMRVLLIPTTSSATVSHFSGFTGSLESQTLWGGEGFYACNGKQFVYVKNDLTLPANKCCLKITSGNSFEQGSRSITIVFDETTKITNTNLTNLTNGDWYDLNGRKLNGMPTKKGVYIMNGRKVVVK